jgi:DNA repair exonuclease SbcCD ATPase subunit
MIQALHLDRKHDLEQDKSLLTTLFDKKTRYFDLNTSDQQCQTNVEIDDLMHMKIRDIDNTVRTNKIDYDTRQINQLEQRLLSCQREIEEQSKKQVEQQIETFKTIELTRLKIQAKKETQIQLDRQQSLFEEKLLSFESQHISNLEQERKRMLDREREMDRNNLFLKQSLLDENNKLMFKEKELRNESDLIAKQFELERDLLKNQVQQYQNQVHSLNEFKERYAQKMEESIASYKINLNKEHFQSKSDLEVEKTKLLGERTNLEAMMLKVRKSENYKSEAKDLEQKLDQMTKDRDEQMIKFKDIQLKLLTQQNQSSFEFELTSLKR